MSSYRDRAVRDARRANREVYETGDVVAEYLRIPYHVVRMEVARQQLVRHVPRSTTGAGGRRPVVLELGSGGGEPHPDLARRFSVVRSDVEIQALASVGTVRSSAVCLDATGWFPLAGESVDGILMGELIEHVFDTRRLLQECHRVLRPGGALVLTTPNLATVQDRIRFLAGRAPRQVNPLHEYLVTHIRPFTASQLADVLRRCGFTVRPVRANFVVWRIGERRVVESRLLARLAPTLGASLICAAVKER